ncbi:MAG: Zn-ribbon domain-containing OB-fold protein [candidate division WOR-3 bacterium]|nr:Zn-ribbon domain-containing OB-fold protein [candidate division WOR-3 bacterium]
MPSPRYTREIPQRYRLEAAKCKKCGKIFFPPRLVCSNCKSREFEKITLSEEGKIVTYTTIRVAPEQFSTQVPYNIAIIELNDGVRLMAQVVDCKPEDMAIGKPVRMVFRKIQEEGAAGIICYGYKAVLA